MGLYVLYPQVTQSGINLAFNATSKFPSLREHYRAIFTYILCGAQFYMIRSNEDDFSKLHLFLFSCISVLLANNDK